MKLVAYIPTPEEGCKSLLCRRQPTEEDPELGDCIGWHCSVCRQPSSQYGHTKCHEATE